MHQPVTVVRSALVDDAAQLAGDIFVVRRDRAALAGGQLLVRVEAVDGRVSVRPHRDAVDASAQCLAGVLDNRHVRGPLVALDDDEVAALRAALQKAGLL